MAIITAVKQGSRTILVEVDENVTITAAAGYEEHDEHEVPDGFAPVSKIERLREAITDAGTLIRETSEMVIEAIDQLAGSPDKVTAEFGIKFAGEAGIPVVTKGTVEAALKLTIEWERGGGKGKTG